MDYVHLNAPINLSVDLGSELKPAFLGIMNAVPSYITVPVPAAPAGTYTTIANPYKAPTIAALSAASYELDYPVSKQDVRRFTLHLQKPLYTGGRVKNGVSQVKNAYAALDERSESKRREVALTTVKAYLGAVLAHRAAVVSQEAYETVSQHVKQAESLFKQGLIPRYELMRAQTELANQDRRLLDSQNQANPALAFLIDAIGPPDAETPTLTTSLDGTGEMPLDYEKAASIALDSNTDMKALQYRDRFFAAAVRSAKSERFPVVALFASADMRDEDLSILDPKSYVGVMAKLPILDGGVTHAKVTQQIAQKERNKTDMTRLRNGIKLEVRKNYLDLMSGKKALEAADKAVELATESRRLAVRRFEVGEGTSMEVTDAVLALSIAETNREQARYQYDLAYYSLKKALGQLIDEFQK
jgi:outer membrane protein